MPSKRKSKRAKLASWQYAENPKPFSQNADDLLTSEPFKKLNYGAREVYHDMLSYKMTTAHNQALYKALRDHAEYNHFSNHDMKMFLDNGELSEFDLERIADDRNKPLLVFPKSAGDRYGIDDNTLYRAITALKEGGFISTFANCKGALKLCEIYVFSSEWKKSEKSKEKQATQRKKKPHKDKNVKPQNGDYKSNSSPQNGDYNTEKPPQKTADLVPKMGDPLIYTPDSVTPTNSVIPSMGQSESPTESKAVTLQADEEQESRATDPEQPPLTTDSSGEIKQSGLSAKFWQKAKQVVIECGLPADSDIPREVVRMYEEMMPRPLTDDDAPTILGEIRYKASAKEKL